MIAVALAAPLVLQPLAPAEAASASRIGGIDRYETSAMLSQQNPTAGSTVFLASSSQFPDALAAGPVAAAEDAHLLLTAPDSLPAAISAEISRLRATAVVIVGGEAAITAAVATAAASIPGVSRVDRIAGSDRYQTALQLLDRQRQHGQPWTMLITSGSAFPDALVASAVAARFGLGLILTDGSTASLDRDIVSRLSRTGAVHIVGGLASVSSDVEGWFSERVAVARDAGADRYETAVALNRAFTGSTSQRTIVLASGESFADALGAGLLAGELGMPMYLTPQACAPSTSVSAEAARLGANRVLAIGGPAAVSDVAASLQQCVDPSASVSQMLAQINAQRATNGLPAFVADAGLMAVAQGWAGQMASQGLSGSAHNPNAGAQIKTAGFTYWGEAVGRNQSAAAGPMLTVWLNSSAHRALILHQTNTHIGIGTQLSSNGLTYWVLDFGRR